MGFSANSYLGILDAVNAFDIIAEQKITEAMKAGVFDSNPFNGIPMQIDDDYSLSAESRFRLRYFKSTRVSSEVVNHLSERWRLRRLAVEQKRTRPNER